MIQIRLFEFHKRCKLCKFEFHSKYSATQYCMVCRAIIDGKYYRVEKLKQLMKDHKPVYHNWLNDRDRITLDIDNPEEDLDQALKMIKRYGFTEDIEIRVSPSGKGRHVIGHTKQGSYPVYQHLFIRYLCKDDIHRVILDAKADRMRQVIFTRKSEIEIPDHIREMYRKELVRNK